MQSLHLQWASASSTMLPWLLGLPRLQALQEFLFLVRALAPMYGHVDTCHCRQLFTCSAMLQPGHSLPEKARLSVHLKICTLNFLYPPDWDIHHGNGIQHIFEDDPSVLYMSVHRYDGCAAVTAASIFVRLRLLWTVVSAVMGCDAMLRLSSE